MNHSNDNTEDNNNNNNSNDDKQAAFNINMTRCVYGESETLLSHAIDSQSFEVIEYLLSFNNIDLNAESFYRFEEDEFCHTPLMYAVWRTPEDNEKRLKIIQLLLNHPNMTKKCINKTRSGYYKHTALDYACEAGDSEAVRLLVKHGANTAGIGYHSAWCPILYNWPEKRESRYYDGEDVEEVDKGYEKCIMI